MLLASHTPSPLMGEGRGEGDQRSFPLTSILSPKGRGESIFPPHPGKP